MKAIYPLSADPIHEGHIGIIKKGLECFDEVTLVIANNPHKKYVFSLPEREFLAKKVIEQYFSEGVSVNSFDGMVKNYALENGYKWVIRGTRNSQDFEFEKNIAEYHHKNGLETAIFFADPESSNLSSSGMKEIIKSGGIITDIHPSVKQALEERLCDRSIIGVTGSMGSGKSTFCKGLCEYGKEHSMNINHIDIDRMVKEIYSSNSAIYKECHENIKKEFGNDIFDEKGFNRKKAIEIIKDKEKEKKFSEMLKVPFMIKLENELKDRHGIILVDAAYIVEKHMFPIVNYNIMNVVCEEDVRLSRILERDNITQEELDIKSSLQLGVDERKALILEAQKSVDHGFYREIDTTTSIDYEKIFDDIKNTFPMFGKKE